MQTIAKSQSNLVVQVHPLVIMNAADHCNRAKYIEPKQNRVMGVLLGKQEDKVLEVVNSVEISFKHEANQILIDETYLQRRLEAYKKMYPTLDCLGWYSTGVLQAQDTPDVKSDLQI
jgi:COP9 signalosome complex subunit 6